MHTTTLINLFQVPAEREDEFVAAWRSAAAYLATCPGYVSTRLHRAIDRDAEYTFVNVAQWASPEAFRAATASPEFRKLAGALAGFPSLPGLFSVEYEHSA
ncbi:antibiotic biosynthesis monooxygenase family protein [Streptomyces sp. NPDC050625]|uniref:antibiotic biosynthesis monooxygenase family protein n=1 Tax=Streptomyces sp. NPDC050625 TaxID=3154629 RepID=UPI0034348C70